MAVRYRGRPSCSNGWFTDTCWQITSWGAVPPSPQIALSPRLQSRPWPANNTKMLSHSWWYRRGHVHHSLFHARYCLERFGKVDITIHNFGERYSLPYCRRFVVPDTALYTVARKLCTIAEDLQCLTCWYFDCTHLSSAVRRCGSYDVWLPGIRSYTHS